MTLTPGTRFGSYEVAALIGTGGMGEVYRATDVNLGRPVAIKVLPPSWEQDPDRLARFTREAKALASLNHPNIAIVHGFERAGDGRALVMELVEGPTLADLLTKGAMPLDEALAIARQIANALEAAHDQGIVHRDLKPANVKVRTDGTVKVLDFGLAKTIDGVSAESASALRHLPTITTPAMTELGVILGTAAYMSPEQARGRPVDTRADIWAFGCVLYEMVTGARPFGGEDVGDTLAAVIKDTPAWDRVPLRVRRLIVSCLEKDPRQRLRDIGDAWRLLADDAPMPSGAVTVARDGSRLLTWAAVVGAAAIAAATTAAYFRSKADPPLPPAARFTFGPSARAAGFRLFISGWSISPDGSRIVFNEFESQTQGRSVLYVRRLDSLESTMLPGTQGANFPAWSPDNRSITFFSEDKLRRMDIGGGPPVILCDAPRPRGATWSRNGTILFASKGRLMRVPASGGIPQAVIDDDSDPERGQPQFLPDGDHFLYIWNGGSATPQLGVYASSLSRPDRPSFIVATGSRAMYVPPLHEPLGRLLYVRGDTLLTQPYDLDRLRVEGEATRIADGIATRTTVREASFYASDTGVLAYSTGMTAPRSTLQWIDRSGTVVGEAAPEDNYSSLRLSPDGTRVAIGRRNAAGFDDQWVLDLVRGGATRLTFDPGRETYPVWSADGAQIAFAANPAGTYQVYRMPAEGGGKQQQLTNLSGIRTIDDWSRDGRVILFSRSGARTGADIWALPMSATAEPVPVVETPANEDEVRFSPDSKWIAYTSDQSGRVEVYVQGYPTPGERIQISTNGGARPLWRRDGRELFFFDGRAIAAAEIRVIAGRIESGAIRSLFPFAMLEGIAAPYDISLDGRRFLALVAAPAHGDAGFTVLTNWQTTLNVR